MPAPRADPLVAAAWYARRGGIHSGVCCTGRIPAWRNIGINERGKTMRIIIAVLLLLPGAALAASAFDGTWKLRADSVKTTGKADRFQVLASVAIGIIL